MSEPKVTYEEFITPPAELKPSDSAEPSYVELPAEAAEAFVEAGTVTETVYVSEALPEGYSMMIGVDGQQYVTIVQDSQTYAIPIAGMPLCSLKKWAPWSKIWKINKSAKKFEMPKELSESNSLAVTR